MFLPGASTDFRHFSIRAFFQIAIQNKQMPLSYWLTFCNSDDVTNWSMYRQEHSRPATTCSFVSPYKNTTGAMYVRYVQTMSLCFFARNNNDWSCFGRTDVPMRSAILLVSTTCWRVEFISVERGWRWWSRFRSLKSERLDVVSEWSVRHCSSAFEYASMTWPMRVVDRPIQSVG